MDAYRISETDADLPSLIDRVAAGEQVLITRDGNPVAELRPLDKAAAAREALDRLTAGLANMPRSPISSVELLRRMYEENDVA